MERLDAYLDVFEAIRREKRWSESAQIYRLVALTLSGQDPNGLGDRLRATSERLRERSGWFDPLRSTIRHTVSALLLVNDIEPEPFHDRVKAIRRGFRARRMQRGNTYEVMGACLLAFADWPNPPAEEKLDRTKAFLENWNKVHPIITGGDDYPMAALHANLGRDVEEESDRIEQLYRGLVRAKFAKGNVSQLVSHLLAVADDEPEVGIARFIDLRDRAKALDLPVRGYSQADLALLSLVPGDTALLSRLAAELRDGLRASERRPDERLAGSLAMGLVVHEALQRLDSEDLRAIATLPAMQAILAAQQAAMVAATTASTAAMVATS